MIENPQLDLRNKQINDIKLMIESLKNQKEDLENERIKLKNELKDKDKKFLIYKSKWDSILVKKEFLFNNKKTEKINKKEKPKGFFNRVFNYFNEKEEENNINDTITTSKGNVAVNNNKKDENIEKDTKEKINEIKNDNEEKNVVEENITKEEEENIHKEEKEMNANELLDSINEILN